MMTESYNVYDIGVDVLRPFPYRTTHLLKPDARQLALSVRQYGVLMPLLVNEDTSEVLDGAERVKVALDLGIETLPVRFVDVDTVDAMLLHVQINRYRSSVVNSKLSEVVRNVSRSGKYTDGEIRVALGLTMDEFQVLRDGSVIRQRKIPDHTFSKAWVPVESSSSDDFRIERPTGKAESEG